MARIALRQGAHDYFFKGHRDVWLPDRGLILWGSLCRLPRSAAASSHWPLGAAGGLSPDPSVAGGRARRLQVAITSGASSIVSAVIGMGKNLGMQVVAEGVESREQLTCLRKLACPQGQGFYLSEPLTAAEFSRLCRHSEAQQARSVMRAHREQQNDRNRHSEHPQQNSTAHEHSPVTVWDSTHAPRRSSH